MLNRPRFRPHFHVEVVPGEGVILLSDSKQTLLQGRLYELMAPWLDGRTANDVCARLQGQASPAEVYYALTQLERKDYLCEDDAVFPPGQAALWSSQRIAPAIAAQRLAERTVVIRTLNIDAGPLLALLQSLHVRVAEEGPADVLLTDCYRRNELRAVNAEALRAGRPWMLVKPVGRQVWIGPLFQPGSTGCWECLAHRLRSNSPVVNYLEGRNGHAVSVVTDRAATPATMQVAWGLAANAVASWVVHGVLPELDGRIQTFDIPTWRLQTHTLVRLPFCLACGNRAEPRRASDMRPPILHRCKKTFTNDGGHRVAAPEETIARYGHHVSPITGAVPLLERAGPNGNGVLHVYLAGQNTARPHHDLGQLREDLRSMCAGKGITDLQARTSGLCEGLERYSGVFRGDEPRRRARRRELGDAAVSLQECLLFSDRQYRERETRNASASAFSYIPLPFDADAEIEWTPVWSLTRQAVRYLPTSFCYYDYPQPEEQTFCVACSNGNAAGNTLEEAILQGFLELVERDSVALWWYNRVRRPGIDVESFGELYLERLRVFLEKHGREYWALDLTADLGIPVVAAVCRRTDGPAEQILFGFGAHLEPRVALLRAVTEMIQMLSSPMLAPASNNVDDRRADPETAHWLRTATVANQPYLLPDAIARRHVSSFPHDWSEDVSEDIRACQSRIERAGLEMLVLEQTRPEIGLPVAKVTVPGMRHFWNRFAPGRLYEVPVRLGWLPRPLAEDELNPVAMFL